MSITKDQAIEILNATFRASCADRVAAGVFLEALASAGAFADGATVRARLADALSELDEEHERERAAAHRAGLFVAFTGVLRRLKAMPTFGDCHVQDVARDIGVEIERLESVQPSRPAATQKGALTASQTEEACAARLVMLAAIHKHRSEHDKAHHYREAANDIRRDGAVARGLASVEQAAKDWPARKRKAADSEQYLAIPEPPPILACSKARAEEILNEAFARDSLHGTTHMIEALDRARAFPSEAALAEIERLARIILRSPGNYPPESVDLAQVCQEVGLVAP